MVPGPFQRQLRGTARCGTDVGAKGVFRIQEDESVSSSLIKTPGGVGVARIRERQGR